MISKCQKECLATSKGILYYDLGHGNVGNTSIHWLDVWLCSVLGVTLRWYAHWTFVLHLCSHRNAGTFSTEECVLFRCILTGRMQVFFCFVFVHEVICKETELSLTWTYIYLFLFAWFFRLIFIILLLLVRLQSGPTSCFNT